MTISSTTRTAGPFSGNNVTTTFAFAFKVFQASDLQLVRTLTSTGVSTTLTITTDYTVSLNADQNSAPGGSVTLTSALATGYTLIVTSDIAALQATDLTNQGGFYPQVITNALDKLTILTQQILGKVGRSLNFPIQDTGYNPTLPAKAQRVGRVLAFDETTGDPAAGPTIADVQTVSAASTAIATVATNIASVNTDATNITNINTVAGGIADVNAVGGSISNVNTVATNISSVNNTSTNMSAVIAAPTEASAAAASATAAAASASAAAAAAAAGMYSAVQDKSANYTVQLSDAGDLIRMTTTSGALTVTLPLISTLPDGFNVTVVKWTSDANSATVARSGSNTINGGTTYALDAQYKSVTLVADLDTGTWFASGSGSSSTSVTVDAFTGNGSTTAFTLSGDPGSKNNTLANVGGVFQLKSTYSLSGTVVTFSSAPPNGTLIEIQWSQPLSIGTPADGTVSTIKLADGAVTTSKIAAGAVDKVKLDVRSSDGTGAMGIPSGTTAQRPASPAPGDKRWNTTLGQEESWTGSGWQAVASNTYTVDYLVVAGGGGGGEGNNAGGGGGGGGFLTGSAVSVSGGAAYTITIGGGGAGATVQAPGTSGANSSFGALVTSLGGGGGGGETTGLSGGSGGGGGSTANSVVYAGGAGTAGQGFAGGSGLHTVGVSQAGGGGGGASAVGTNYSGSTGGNGGAGLASSITGTSATYAGGGGGGAGGIVGSGGAGGGGAGGGGSANGSVGSVNTGGGGGGGYTASNGGNGGSGIIVIRYAGAVARATGGTITITGGYVIHTFTSSGTYTA